MLTKTILIVILQIILLNKINAFLIKRDGEYAQVYIGEKANYKYKINIPSDIDRIERYEDKELINNRPKSEYKNHEKVKTIIEEVKGKLTNEICYNNQKKIIKLGTTEFKVVIECDENKAIIRIDNNTFAIKRFIKFDNISYMSSEYKIYRKDKLCVSNTLTSTCYDPSYVKIEIDDLNTIFNKLNCNLTSNKIYMSDGKYNIHIKTLTKEIFIMYHLISTNKYTTILNQESIRCKKSVCNERYDYNIKCENGELSVIKLN